MSICGFYAEIYVGVPLSSQSTANSVERQEMLDSALPELYAAVIVFAVKARAYFEARGMYMWSTYIISLNYAKPKSGLNKFANTLKSFDVEFRPFVDEISAKEGAIREYADAATMGRIKSMVLHMVWDTIGQILT